MGMAEGEGAAAAAAAVAGARPFQAGIGPRPTLDDILDHESDGDSEVRCPIRH